jgi:hypothetical protein
MSKKWRPEICKTPFAVKNFAELGLTEQEATKLHHNRGKL